MTHSDTITINAICTMLEFKDEIMKLDYSSFSNLLKELKEFCIVHQVAYDDMDAKIRQMLIDGYDHNPDWQMLIIFSKKMRMLHLRVPLA